MGALLLSLTSVFGAKAYGQGLLSVLTNRSVLFLQGPLGPFFRELASAFSATGYVTHKINFNGGDQFYSGADQVTDYCGTPEQWPDHLRQYLQQNNIEAVFLLGDCRYYHRVARPVCEQLGVAFMVFEEGYLRPDTITLEPGGVNALSGLDVSVENILATPVGSVKAPGCVYGSDYESPRFIRFPLLLGGLLLPQEIPPLPASSGI